MREPLVAGRFYESSEKALIHQIESSFIHPMGPGSLPFNDTSQKNHIKKGKIKGIISPHAGYYFSAPCAAHGFLELSRFAHSKKILLIGPSHRGDDSCFSEEDFLTPLGVMKTDKNTVKELSEQFSIPINAQAHYSEHSLEVQVPFIQYLDRLNPGFEIIPLMLSHDCDPAALGRKIAAYKEDLFILVSGDFTHYGTDYGYTPQGPGKKGIVDKIDKEYIDKIITNDSKGFYDLIRQNKSTVCGALPILLLLAYINKKGRLLKYYNSGDILNDYNNAVGYASILF
jgi:MEMO1 family protein